MKIVVTALGCIDALYPHSDPGLFGKITVSITKEDNFFIFTIQKSKNFIKFMKSFDRVTGRSVRS